MEFTAQQIAGILNGEVEGSNDVKVSNISPIENGLPGTLSFLANPKYTKFIYTTQASIVLVNKNFVPEKELQATLIRVEDAYSSFASLLELYNQTQDKKTGIHKQACVENSARVGENTYIGAFTYVGLNAKIGNNVKLYPQVYIGDNVEVADNTVLYAGVKVYKNCKIGQECIIHSGAVVGSDGFGFAPKNKADYKKVPQLGNVIIEDKVEIGSNCSIDRATMGSTIIRKGVKLDNLIQVAHNVEIGDHTVIAAQTGVSGSTKIGKDCLIAGQVGFTGHITIADNTKIGAQSGISSHIRESGKILLGSPADSIGAARKSIVIYKQLPELRNKILNLEKQIEELKKQTK